MKAACLVTLLCWTSYTFSQQFTCGFESQQDLYRFVSKNLDSIRKYSDGDSLVTRIELSDEGAFKKVTFYSDYNDETEVGTEANAWDGLHAYIARMFAFCPATDFPTERGLFSVQQFSLPLSEKHLATAVREMLLGQQQLSELSSPQVSPGSKFTVNVDKLIILNRLYTPMKLTGILDAYESGSLQLGSGIYLVFNIIKSSEQGFLKEYIDYKIFRVGGGSATLIKRSGYICMKRRPG